jgi:uncharacterized SAM-binding protein YcdF (DUF218 family)
MVRPVDVTAIVLLGCRVGAEGQLFGAAARRAEVAAAAWQRRPTSYVIASGGRRWYGIAEAEAFARELVRRGVDEAAIVREWMSMSTAENALFSARILRSRGTTRLSVVTCDWHMPRALASFARAGVEASALPVASPDVGVLPALRRRARERASFLVDRAATWGFLHHDEA